MEEECLKDTASPNPGEKTLDAAAPQVGWHELANLYLTQRDQGIAERMRGTYGHVTWKH